MINAGMMSSATDNWPTPQWLFDKLNEEYHFTLDAAADDENHKCDRYFTAQEDGLSQKWGGGGLLQSTVWTADRPLGRKGI